MAPVGRWGIEGSSLRPECRSEERTQATEDAVSTPILFNPAAEAAVSLLGGVANREETLNTSRAVCGCFADAEGADDRYVLMHIVEDDSEARNAEVGKQVCGFPERSGGCPQSCPTGAESEGSVGWLLWSETEQLTADRHRFGCSSEASWRGLRSANDR